MRSRVALVAGGIVAVLLLAVLAGCAPSKAQVAEQDRQQCFANEQQIKMAMDAVYADSDIYPNVADVVAKLGVKCPDGGTYSFDPNTDTVSCSVHGHP